MLIPAAVLLAVNGVYAQEVSPIVTIEESTDKHKVETNRFRDNWFISAGAGGQMYFGDHNRQMTVGKKLSPALDLSVGKWFTPGLGVRMVYSGLSIKGTTQNGSHSTGEIFDASQNLSYSKFNYGHVHGDVMFNLTNMICGYKSDRIYSVTPYVGLGMMFTYDSPKHQAISANLGVLNTFRLSSALDLNIDVRSTMVSDHFDGEAGGRKFEGLLSTTVGLTYKFKSSGWKRKKTKTVVYNNEPELKALRARMNNMQRDLEGAAAENARLSEELAKAPKEVRVESTFIPKQITVFNKGTSTLTKEARVNLGFFAKVLLANTDKQFAITGFADNRTGSAQTNERISRARAQAVYDCLVQEYKIPSSILSIHSMGGVDDMFYNDSALSRSVIIELLP